MDMEKSRLSFGAVSLKWTAIMRPRANACNTGYFMGKHKACNSLGEGEVIAEKYSGGQMLLSKAGSRIFSGVKRLFRRVEKSRGVETIRDFLWGGYQKLPKPSSFSLFSCREPKVHQSFRNYRNFYSDSDGYYVWSSDEDESMMHTSTDPEGTPIKGTHVSSGKIDLGQNVSSSSHGRQQKFTGSFLNFGNIRHGRLVKNGQEAAAHTGNDDNNNKRKPKQLVQEKSGSASNSNSKFVAMSARAEACSKFEQKLRELVMDQNNLEDVLDIEEFLHYYSRLSSPFYIEMVNQFFMDICGEFLPVD